MARVSLAPSTRLLVKRRNRRISQLGAVPCRDKKQLTFRKRPQMPQDEATGVVAESVEGAKTRRGMEDKAGRNENYQLSANSLKQFNSRKVPSLNIKGGP